MTRSQQDLRGRHVDELHDTLTAVGDRPDGRGIGQRHHDFGVVQRQVTEVGHPGVDRQIACPDMRRGRQDLSGGVPCTKYYLALTVGDHVPCRYDPPRNGQIPGRQLPPVDDHRYIPGVGGEEGFGYLEEYRPVGRVEPALRDPEDFDRPWRRGAGRHFGRLLAPGDPGNGDAGENNRQEGCRASQ
jgi:hypothetical protein